MKNFFSIKQAAKIVNMTSETLRYYDRIGLVIPCYKDESSGYRYYSEQELIRLQTIGLLKYMDLSLTEIKDILQLNDLSEIIALLKRAEKNTEQKIAQLQYAKSKIKRAYTDYEKKLDGVEIQNNIFTVTHIPERVILISDQLEHPTLKNLWDYHSHFYKQIGTKLQFQFEDRAGIITTNEKTHLFAVCLQYPDTQGLTVLPEGDYLCANCTQDNKERILQELLQIAKLEYGVLPENIIQNIVITGILQWNYQIQLLLDSNNYHD